MATFSKQKLSASTDGKVILVKSSTFSSGNTNLNMHVSVSGSTDWDEIWIYIANTETTPLELEMQWGRTSGSSDTTVDMYVTIPSKSGFILIVPGIILNNSQAVRCRCSTADKLQVMGFVNRITA